MADPFTTGLLAVTAANNPNVAADALSLIGGDTGMANGGFLSGLQNLPGVGPGAGLGQFLQGPGAAGGGLPPGQQQGGVAQGLVALQGFKGPEAVKPEFAGGIRGAQAAPQPNPAGLQTDPIMQLLQQLLQGGGPPPLGNLLGGRQ